MPQIPLAIIPPEYPQDFEKLTLEICKIVWDDPAARLYGRAGYEQFGVDVYGRNSAKGENHFVAVQCKRRNQINSEGRIVGRPLSKTAIEKEIKDAEENFHLGLSEFIIATTTFRDTETQRIVDEINTHQKSKGSFDVHIWFWEDYQAHLNQNPTLMYKFYESVMATRPEYSTDTHALCFFQTAFSRPVFNTILETENSGDDFLQGIADTQKAINTGKLLDRERNVIEVGYKAKQLSRKEWRDKFEQISSLLQEIRDEFTSARKQGHIEQQHGYILIRKHEISEILNAKRRDVLELLNSVLNEANVEPVQSVLLQWRPA